MQIPTLTTGFDAEFSTADAGTRLRERINNTAALSMLLARFADEISNPDPGDFAIVAMASDGIADMLMLAIEEYERVNEREYEE